MNDRRIVSSEPTAPAMRTFDTEKRFIGVHELAAILDVSPESIYAKTSKRNNDVRVARRRKVIRVSR